MRTDNGRTDITKLIVDFRNFVQTCLKKKTVEDSEGNGNKYDNDRGPDCDGRRDSNLQLCNTICIVLHTLQPCSE